ncbi:MAG: hypothetical protein QM724_12260 [Flavobacteriales bacterium]
MTALTFITARDGALRTSDLSEFRGQIRSALRDSYPEDRAWIDAHFGDVKFNQAHSSEDAGMPVALITLTPGTREARELVDRIALTFEERFLFQGSYVEQMVR